MHTARVRSIARVGVIAAMLSAPLVITQVPIARAAVFSLADAMHRGSLGGLGAYGICAVVGSLLLLPLWLISGLAGFAYGFPKGIFAALPAVTLGGTVCFLVGRALANTSFGLALREHPRFKMVDAVVRHDGRRIAGLIRITPVMPQNLLHYAFGATPLRVTDFVLATFVGMIPMTTFHVYMGSLIHDAADLFRQDSSARTSETWIKIGGSLAVTVALLVIVVRLARKALAKAVTESQRAPDASA